MCCLIRRRQTIHIHLTACSEIFGLDLVPLLIVQPRRRLGFWLRLVTALRNPPTRGGVDEPLFLCCPFQRELPCLQQITEIPQVMNRPSSKRPNAHASLR